MGKGSDLVITACKPNKGIRTLLLKNSSLESHTETTNQLVLTHLHLNQISLFFAF